MVGLFRDGSVLYKNVKELKRKERLYRKCGERVIENG